MELCGNCWYQKQEGICVQMLTLLYFQAKSDFTPCLTAIMMLSATVISRPEEIMKRANYEPMQVNEVGTCRETVR